MTCEKCWQDAKKEGYANDTSVYDHYKRILKERENNPCSPKEQAGIFWDDEKGIDKRLSHFNIT